MADLLLNKLINEEISSKTVIKWILQQTLEKREEKEITDYNKVSQIDFVTYFLNFIHEEVSPCKSNFSDTPQKVHTPKQVEKVLNFNAKKDSARQIRTNLFGTSSISQDECSNSLTKTPNMVKTKATRNYDYYSPVSPLYDADSHTKLNENSKHSDKHSLCLGDFLLTSKNSLQKKKRTSILFTETSRRIKPTSVDIKPSNSFYKTENSFNFQDNIAKDVGHTASEERNILAEERLKIASRKESLQTSNHRVLLKRYNSISKTDINPQLNKVMFKTGIDSVIDVYACLIDNKLVLSMTSEIYFLISLALTTQKYNYEINSSPKCLVDNTNLGVTLLEPSNITQNSSALKEKITKNNLYNSEIFKTIHNVVYFAVKTLETQFNKIFFYDKITITLLADNERIREFSPIFAKKLLAIAQEKKIEKSFVDIEADTLQTNVYFNVDTDNRANFPDNTAFHAFRKQRDLFYEILRVWENQHSVVEWDFSLQLGGKIRSLFNLHNGITNFVHLARLFKNQLLNSCAKGLKERGLSEKNVPFMPELSIDAEKLNRLTNRLVTKQSSNGISSVPAFSGYQEFFKDFIVVSSNYMFTRHLSNCLISEIIELNSTQFSLTNLEDKGNEVDVSSRKLYVDCLRSLRILAKFLGFIESLPYMSDMTNVSRNELENQIELRKKVTPMLDVKSLLETAIGNHSVVFIIPWLTKYLSVLDYVTLRLPYYISLYTILFDLYQNYDSSKITQYNAMMIKLCLGWLFELPHFPETEYFNFCSKFAYMEKHGKADTLCKQYDSKKKTNYLDFLAIVNQSVLYVCCPFLEEIKKLLSVNASESRISVKYITPVTAVDSNADISKKKIEQQLQDAFFNAQSLSVRKIVEFVSERIASSAVKFICHDMIPNAKLAARKDLKDALFKNDIFDLHSDISERMILLDKESLPLAQNHLTIFLESCEKEIQKIGAERIPMAIQSLLSIDTLEETRNICIGVTNKMYMERVNQWILNHVNLSVFTEEFKSDIKKFAKYGKKIEKDKSNFILPDGGRDCSHNDNTLSAFHALNNINEICCVANEQTEINVTQVVWVLEETVKTLTQRNDVNDMIGSGIFTSTFDLCLMLVAKFTLLFSQNEEELLTFFIKVWVLENCTTTIFASLFCPRNVKILQNSRNRPEAWTLFARIVSHLLDKKLIDEDDLESQCTGFYNRDWKPDVLESFSHFLKTLVSFSSSGKDKFVYLLDFLSDFCSDL